MSITVINKHITKEGPADIYIGRPTIYGNPFSHLPCARYRVNTREDAVESYRTMLKAVLRGKDTYSVRLDDTNHCLKPTLTQKHLLSLFLCMGPGVRLSCWCAPLACHANVLVKAYGLWVAGHFGLEGVWKKGLLT